MRSTLFVLTLLSLAPLSVGCEDPQSAPKPAKVKREVSAPQPSPTLTSVTPTGPRSVADVPMTKVALPKAEEKKFEEPKPEQVAGTQEDLKATEQAKSPVDYDRPLSPSEVSIVRFVLATGVEDREPLDERDVFSAETPKIFAFVHFDNEHGAPYALRVHWEKVDGPASPYGFKLTVPTAKRHRTWSWTAIRREPGQYRAVLRTLDGKEVASREFTLE